MFPKDTFSAGFLLDMNEKELADSVFGGLMAKAMGKMVHESEICPLVEYDFIF